MRVVQFSAGFNEGDAISNEMLYLKELFSKRNIDCEIYSQNIGITGSRLCKRYNSYSHRNNDIIIYHHSIHSKVFEFIKNHKKFYKKILIYHNVTPHDFIKSYDLSLAYFLQKGREELDEMKDFFDINLADSAFNKSELDRLGFKNVSIFPIKLNLSKYKQYEKINSDIFRILFVGRIAPNKKQCDLIKLSAVLKKYNFPFKLFLAGKTSPELISYKLELDNLIKFFHIESNVEFYTSVNQDTLASLYSNSDLFICMSEHEGFCVPILEALYYKLPIIAYNAGAVPETLGSGGIIFSEKKLDYISELIFKISSDINFKNSLINAGQRRFQQLNSEFDSIDFIMRSII